MKYRIVVPGEQKKRNGKLIWIGKRSNPVTLMEDKPFPLLQIEKARLVKEPCYQPSKGKFTLKYMKL